MAKEKKKGIIAEFREFITKGNVLDMAVGVIIATAFGKITTALVNNVFMPFISWLVGSPDLSTLDITLRPAVEENGEVVKEALVLGLGTFITAIIDFILIALIVFLVVKAFNTIKAKAEARRKKEEEEEKEEPAPEEPSEEVLLLREIRDSLKKD